MTRSACLLTLLLARPAWADTLTVGAGQQFAKPSEAARAARDGDTVRIEPGDYYDCATWRQNRLTIVGTGPGVVMTDRTCEGKAIFVVAGSDVTLRDVTLARARVPDRNGAGIRLEGQGLTLERVRFLKNEVGVLAGTPGAGMVHIVDCVFEGGGRGGDRPLFAVSTGEIGRLKIEGSTFKDNSGGQIRSAAELTELKHNQIATGSGDDPAVAVLESGAELIMQDNVFSVGPTVPRQAAAVLVMGEGPTELRRNRLENTTGRSLAMVISWSDGDTSSTGDIVGGGDSVVSSSGSWRHRLANVAHQAKDTLQGIAGLAKRAVKALLGR